MELRKPTIKDFNKILDLQLQLEDAEIVFDDNLIKHAFDTEEGRKILKKRIRNKNVIFYVALDNNEIVGFIDGKIPDDEWWYKSPVAYLNHIVVDKKYRKKGVATLLLNKFEEIVKEKNIKYIRLLAFPNNKPAINFYKKNKFMEYSTYYQKTNH